MTAKTNTRSLWTIPVALVVIISCLFVFTACGGTPIEQDEALTALSNATSTEKYSAVGDYTVEQIVRSTRKTETSDSTLNTKMILSVADNDGQKVGSMDVSGDLRVQANSGGLTTNNNTQIKSNFDIAQIGGAYYYFNTDLQKKQTISQTDYLTRTSFAATMADVKVITQNDIETNIQEPAKVEFKSANSTEATAELTGENIINAYASYQLTSGGNYEYGVVIEFDAEGTQKFYELTSAQQGNSIYIFINDELFSAPIVNSAISNGNVFISGSINSLVEAEYYALQIMDNQPNITVTTDLKKVGDNSYNLNFVIQQSVTENDETTYSTERYYYEIRDGSLTKYIAESTVEKGLESTNTYLEYNIKYSANQINVPTDVANYTEESFTVDLGDILV